MHGISYNCPYKLPEKPYNARCEARALYGFEGNL